MVAVVGTPRIIDALKGVNNFLSHIDGHETELSSICCHDRWLQVTEITYHKSQWIRTKCPNPLLSTSPDGLSQIAAGQERLVPSSRQLTPTDYRLGGVDGGWTVGPASTWVTVALPDGSRSLVRLVALRMPIPISTMTPTPIHIEGTLSKYAPNASPTVRIKNPMTYDANDDMTSALL
jgi:hypothetical protein